MRMRPVDLWSARVKEAVIMRLASDTRPRRATQFSDGTVFLCHPCPPPWPRGAVSGLLNTRDQLTASNGAIALRAGALLTGRSAAALSAGLHSGVHGPNKTKAASRFTRVTVIVPLSWSSTSVQAPGMLHQIAQHRAGPGPQWNGLVPPPQARRGRLKPERTQGQVMLRCHRRSFRLSVPVRGPLQCCTASTRAHGGCAPASAARSGLCPLSTTIRQPPGIPIA
jgi:hypothetical protein